MSNSVKVKICGLTQAAEVEAASAAGAAYVGFVFFPKSPRAVLPSAVPVLAAAAPPGVAKVALVVDPDDALIDTVSALPIDVLQLHGKETPERVAEVRARVGLPVMKALGVRVADDLDAVEAYAPVVDQILIDAKPPLDADLPGGNGLAFDWNLVANRRWPVPWMLAGGLTPENVAEAVRLTGAQQVDVSSGVESSPGQKDVSRIRAFIAAAQA